MAQLQTAVQNLTGVIGSVNTTNGDISLLATDPTATLTVGGTASPSTFGIQTPTVAPGNGTVIGSDLTTFTNQSVAGGSITAYDSEGNPLNIQFRWAQVGSGSGDSTWNLFYQTNSSATGTQSAWQNVGQNFIFNSSGQLIQPTSSAFNIPALTVNGDTLNNVEINFGSGGLTQFANSSGTAQVTQLQQNGFAAGQLQSVAVDSENRVVGTFTNGQTIPLAQITLATFNGENSLQALNGGAYAATAEFRAADLRRNRQDRRQFAGILQRRYLHPVQQSDRGAAGLFGQRPRHDDGEPDDPEPAASDPVISVGEIARSPP